MRRIMGGLRGRGEESVQRYKMHEKLVTIGDDYWIENEAGERGHSMLMAKLSACVRP